MGFKLKPPPPTKKIVYNPSKNLARLFVCHDDSVLVEGPMGTGKSRAVLELCHLRQLKYAGSRGLMVRRTRASMTETCMFTFQKFVLHASDNVNWSVTDQKYTYPNGSEIVVCGLDNIVKLMSGEYDWIYVQEATEIELVHWEMLTTRLRAGIMPYQQMIADCNPGDPRHWLHVSCLQGKITSFPTTHHDNPVLWDITNKKWTEKGEKYIARLDALTGASLARNRHGLWVAAEGIVYEEWDRTLNLVDAFSPPEDWLHYWVVDFGYRDPFVWQHWRVDGDGRMYLQEEIYMTGRIVQDHCWTIKQRWLDEGGRPKYEPMAIICDHDAEGRAVIEKELMRLTVAAYKNIEEGIQAVKRRMKPFGDGKPRLFYMRDAIVEVDGSLVEFAKPFCSEQEVTSYIWKAKPTRIGVEEPEDKNNHGMDSMRYLVAYLDDLAIDPHDEEIYVEFEDRVRISAF